MTLGDALARHLAYFGERPEPDAQALRALGDGVRRVSCLDDMLSDGDRPTHVVIVLEGLLVRDTNNRQGSRQI